MKLRKGFALVLLCLFTLSAGAATTVTDVQIHSQTDTPVDESSVRVYIQTEEGEEFSRAAVSRDVRALQESGRFSFVAVDVEPVVDGVVVTFTVTPKLRLRNIKVSGAHFFSSKKVLELMELQRGGLVDDSTIAVMAKKVEEEYAKKYFPDVKITWKVEEYPESGQADVRVRVREGKRVKVKNIEFAGTYSLKDRILRKAMTQKPANIFSFLTGTGVFKPNELSSDVETLRTVFLSYGYLDVEIGDPIVTRSGQNRIDIEIPIQEGPQYSLDDVTLEGVTLFPRERVEEVIDLEPGDVASIQSIRSARQRIQDFFGSRGYLRTRVDYDLDADLQQRLVDVHYSVNEGSLAYIRQIKIRGNTRTKDKVIRRELAVYPGDIFNDVKIRRSERRLSNLGYFNYVAATPEPTLDDDQYDLAFEVEEQKTGQFVIGAGFSSIDNIIGFAEISQGNFDLMGWPHFTGGGQKLKLRTQLGTERRDVELSFTEPWFLDRRLSLGIDLFQNERRFLSDEYDQRNTGGRLSLGKSFGGYYRLNLIYGYEVVDVFDVEEDASDLIKGEEGERSKSSLTAEWIYDTRDNPFIPTRGMRSSFSVMGAGGALGADTEIYGVEVRTTTFFPLWFDHVFQVRLRGAVVDEYGSSESVPIFDRLYLGGARTLRGFSFRDVGPKDEDGEPIGGKTLAFGSAEYTMPLVEKIRVAGFYDVGMVYEEDFETNLTDLNSDIGVGVRFDLPGFPLRLDYAWPLEADEFNDRSGGRFQFLIGYVF